MSENPPWAVTWLAVTNHYDFHLMGWLKAGPRNKRFHFKLLQQEWIRDQEPDEDGEFWGAWSLTWGIYEVPQKIMIPHLIEHRSFRRLVGWHFDYDPRVSNRHPQVVTRKISGHTPRTQESMALFYNGARVPNLVLEDSWLVGKSDDLRTIQVEESYASKFR
jgi:hypothetical protein